MPCDPFAVLVEFEQLAKLRLWPGFAPLRFPLALYDGQRTMLLRHPAPPAGFVELSGRPGLWTFAGRYPAITANTALELNGVYTATLLMHERQEARDLAAMLLHEAFHIFQLECHPRWTPNEMELFSYPVEDVELLQLRRLETEALRRALSMEGDMVAAWSQEFLELRGRRFANLPASSVAYERALELFEGLAHYIEIKARGVAGEDLLPSSGFAPAEIRQGCSKVGAALALLLDRLFPKWKERLEAGEAETLEGLLELVLKGREVPIEHFPLEEEEAALAHAEADLEELLAKRAELEREFLGQPGWRITLLSREQPLWPQGFDPLNFWNLGGGRLLHTRWLKLGNARGTVEVFGEALTEGVGDHPLLHGVRRVIVTGLPAEPWLARAEGSIRLEAQGLGLELKGPGMELRQKDMVIAIEF